MKRKLVGDHVGIIYNCKVGRDRKTVRLFITALLHSQMASVALLQEAEGYADVLDNIPGYDCYQDCSAPDSGNLAILIRKDLVSKKAWIRTMKKRWWGAKNKVWRKPRSILMLRAVGVRWANVHRVAYLMHNVNREANKEIDAFICDFSNRGRKGARRIIAGDINQAASAPEIQRLRSKARLKIRTVGGIDYLFYKGNVEVPLMEKLGDGGSDHHARKFRFKTYRRTFR